MLFINENAFDFKGKSYVAQPQVNGCRSCAFFKNPFGACERPVDCTPRGRTDGNNVIFVEKQP